MIKNEDMLLLTEIEQIFARYASALDDGPLQDWPAFFCDDCYYEIIPRDNFDEALPLAIVRCESRAMLEDRVYAIQETMVYEPRYLRHHITNLQINEQNENAVSTLANFSVIEVIPDSLPKILSCGKYLSQWERSKDGNLKIKEQRCVFDSILVPNSLIYPL